MTGTLFSLDLDWFNCQKDPRGKLAEILSHIPPTTPAVLTVEHHEFLPYLERWINQGKVPIPFNVMNVDEHHDYYPNPEPYDPDGSETCCGNWGFRLPMEWYRRYTWVQNPQDSVQCDWEDAQEWMAKKGIVSSTRTRHNLGRLRSDIVAAVFCISPDYLSLDMGDDIVDLVNIIANYFGLRHAPRLSPHGNVYSITDWQMARRPMKMTG